MVVWNFVIHRFLKGHSCVSKDCYINHHACSIETFLRGFLEILNHPFKKILNKYIVVTFGS